MLIGVAILNDSASKRQYFFKDMSDMVLVDVDVVADC